MKVRAVTFDYWNTLCRADVAATAQRRREAWRAVAAERGLAVAPEVVDAVLEHVSEQHHASWLANTQYTAAHAVADAAELLGASLGAADRAALHEAWLDAGRSARVELVEGADRVLAGLAEAGVRLGIVCDVGLTPSVVLRQFLQRHGVLGHFDHWSFSDEVGVYKPDPRIFGHALAGLGPVDPAEAMHVGDLRRTDVAGARRVGMTAVRFRGVADDPDRDAGPDADHVVGDLEELVELVLGG